MEKRYAAFLSYSHAVDRKLAAVVQRALHRLGTPWYRRSAVNIFRDETSLSANPGLRTSIEQNLAKSDYLILLASPDAATSPWVAREIQWWRDHREFETLLIVVSDGNVAWDSQAADFDWQRTTCLPPLLRGFAREEPLYVDIRRAKRRKLLRFRDPQFREAMLMLLAAISGRAKDEIDSEDIRQQRQLKLTGLATGLLIAILTIGAIYAISTAVSSHRESESRRLAAAALAAMENDAGVDRAITLGVLAWRIARTPEAKDALLKLQSRTSGVARILGLHTAGITHLAFSCDSSLLASSAEDGSIILWRVSDWRPTGTVLPGKPITRMTVDLTGSHLLAFQLAKNDADDQYDRNAVLWDVGLKTYRVIPEQLFGDDDGAVLSPDGKLLAFRSDSWRGLVVRDIAAQKSLSQINLPRVEAYRFVDNSNVIFLIAEDARERRNTDFVLRVGRWNISTGSVSMGAYLDTVEIWDIVDYTHQMFSGNGSRLYWPNRDTPLWTVQDDWTLSPLALPDQNVRELPRFGGTAIFDHKGRRVLFSNSQSTRLLVWDLAEDRVIKELSEKGDYGGFMATLSPDGRWLAAVHRSRDAPIVVWDLDQSETVDPATSLRAVCNLEASECLDRLCDKIARTIDEAHLRNLVGDKEFERLNATCGS